MNQEQYLKNAIDTARWQFMHLFIGYNQFINNDSYPEVSYGEVLGAMRVYQRLSGCSMAEHDALWQEAKDFVNYLIEYGSI